MKYLLDTAIWLWSLDSVDRIGRRGLEIMNCGQEEIYFSAATAWEITIKYSLGKLRLPAPPGICVPAFTEKMALRPLPVTQMHALKVYDLPSHHRDPFDRIIIAQAMIEGLAVLTSDRDFRDYPIDIVWCGK